MKSLFKNSKVVFYWGRLNSVRLLTDTCFFFFFNKLHWILKLNIKLHFKEIARDSQPWSQLSQGVSVYASVCARFKEIRAFIKCSAKLVVSNTWLFYLKTAACEWFPFFFKMQLLHRYRAIWGIFALLELILPLQRN